MHPAMAKKQAEDVLQIVLARLESSPFYLDNVLPVAQSVAQIAEGFALLRDADSMT